MQCGQCCSLRPTNCSDITWTYSCKQSFSEFSQKSLWMTKEVNSWARSPILLEGTVTLGTKRFHCKDCYYLAIMLPPSQRKRLLPTRSTSFATPSCLYQPSFGNVELHSQSKFWIDFCLLLFGLINICFSNMHANICWQKNVEIHISWHRCKNMYVN